MPPAEERTWLPLPETVTAVRSPAADHTRETFAQHLLAEWRHLPQSRYGAVFVERAPGFAAPGKPVPEKILLLVNTTAKHGTPFSAASEADATLEPC